MSDLLDDLDLLCGLPAAALVQELWEVDPESFEWTERERQQWSPPPDIDGLEYARTYHKIAPETSAEPGDFDPDRTPHTKEIIEAFCDPRFSKVVVKKCTQAGASEAMRVALGYWARLDPGPCLLVLPTKQSADKMFRKHLEPWTRHVVKDLQTGLTHDITNERIELTTMVLESANAGSPSALAADPRRYVVLDDLDDFPPSVGRQGAPEEVAQSRVRTFTTRGKVIMISSPTTEEGPISQAFEAISDKRFFHLPCGACGEWFIPDWRSGVVWDKEGLKGLPAAKKAAIIRREQRARLKCPDCGHLMTDQERLQLLPEGCYISVLEPEEAAQSTEVAFQFSALVNPWSNLSDLAAKWVTVQGPDQLEALQRFINHELGETFEHVTHKTSSKVFHRKRDNGGPRLIVPKWAGKLIATADTQKNGHPYVIRAWGHGFRSRLVQWGLAEDLEDLYEKTLAHSFDIEGSEPGTFCEERMSPEILAVDSGGGIDLGGISSTRMVYDFAMQHPERVVAVKGQGGENRAKPGSRITPIRYSTIRFKRPGTDVDAKVLLHLLHTIYYKNILDNLILREETGLPVLWEECEEIDDDYILQLTSEKQVLVRVGNRMTKEWRKVSEGRRNDLWDCSVYQIACADLVDVRAIEPEEKLVEKRDKRSQRRRDRRNAPPSQRRFSRADGRPWISRRR